MRLMEVYTLVVDWPQRFMGVTQSIHSIMRESHIGKNRYFEIARKQRSHTLLNRSIVTL